MVQQRFTILTLGVSNLKASTAFYETKLGWTKQASSSNENITFFQLTNGILLSLYPLRELIQDIDGTGSGETKTKTATTATTTAPTSFPPTTAGGSSNCNNFRGFTVAYNTRSKEEVDKIMNDLESKGVTIVKKPQQVFWGGYSGYFRDPDNNMWEVAYNPYLTLDTEGNVIA